MRLRVNDVVAALALAALVNATPIARADEVGFGQHQWVPSLAVTSGGILQNQSATQHSFLFDGEAADPTQPVQLRKPDFGEDRSVAPFVGGAVELMTPSLLPRLRLFTSAEVLPIFAPERHLTDEGQPGLIAGPEVGSVPALEEDNEHFTIPRTQPRVNAFGAIDAKGQGARASAQIDQMSYGAKIGLAWSFQYRGRQMRIKPSVGWFHYRLGVKGFLVHPECNPTNRCTNTYTTTGTLVAVGFLRVPFSLKASDAGIFDAVGPNVDLEMDTGRYGPVATSLFVGVGGYYIPGDRDINFSARKSFDDELGQDTRVAQWQVRVSPWIYRAGVGIRFQWLGEGD